MPGGSVGYPQPIDVNETLILARPAGVGVIQAATPAKLFSTAFVSVVGATMPGGPTVRVRGEGYIGPVEGGGSAVTAVTAPQELIGERWWVEVLSTVPGDYTAIAFVE